MSAPSGPLLTPGLRGGGIAALLVVAFLFGGLAPAPTQAAGVESGAAWLAATQNADGGFASSPDGDSGAEMTAWAMLGLAATDRNPFDVVSGGRTPVDYLRANVGQLKGPGDLARSIIALEAAGAEPRDLGGVNLVSRLLAKRRDDGSYEGWPGSSAFAVIALRAAGAGAAAKPTLDWLRGVQNEDGGWGDVPGSPSTADGTGAAMQALSPSSDAVHRGLSYLRQAQRPGGGFPLGGNGGVNTQSTAWAVQGILAAGGDPGSFRRGGASALDYLASQQQGDGHYRYSKSSDQTPVWVTGQVLVAAAGKYFPVAAPPRKPKPKPSPNAATIPGTSPIPPAPSTSAPVIPPSASAAESASGASGGGSSSGGSGGASTGASPIPGIPTEALPPGFGASGTSGPTGPELLPPEEEPPAATAEPASEDSKSSSAGAIVLGLLAGALLFGAGLGARKLWMRWRYGL